MTDLSRTRRTLMRNLPPRGWNVVGDTGTFENLTVTFGDEEWVITQEVNKRTTNVGKGSYCKTQMRDVRAAAREAGHPFGYSTDSGTSKREEKRQPEGGAPNKKKAQAAARKKKEKKKASEGSADPDSESD